MAASRKTLTLFDDYYDMMSDEVRLSAYREAIAQTVKPGDVVIDLGSGLGILSFLAIAAGAARVYAIEKGDSIELAKAVAEKNGVLDKVVFLNQNSKDVVLPEKADVLVSETLGSFALDENTLEFTLDVRDRLLKPGAKMLPQALRPWLCPVSSSSNYERVEFWREVAGFDFSAAIDQMLSRMSLAEFRSEELLAIPRCYGDFDLRREEQHEVERKMLFQIESPGWIHGLAGWFEADLCDGVSLSTAPGAAKTHWKQAFFPLREPVSVIRGDYMEVTLRVGGKAALSDDTCISYEYRCSQLAQKG